MAHPNDLEVRPPTDRLAGRPGYMLGLGPGEVAGMTGKLVLVILDGVGLRDATEGNAILGARTPTLDRFALHRSRARLNVSGEAVGLPAGQAGNSEVGHQNLGAGRIVRQALTRIDAAIQDGSFDENPVLLEAIDHARGGTGRLHLAGLLSDGGVHSHTRHLDALIDLAARKDVPEVRIHAFTDGRDTSPAIADMFLGELEHKLSQARKGGGIDARIATVTGRYYVMDRDERWERTQRAYQAMVHGDCKPVESGVTAAKESHTRGTTDEFIEPRVVDGVDGRIREGDSVIMFNFRPDRMRQIVQALGQSSFDRFPTPNRPRIYLVTMTKYRDDFPYPAAFPMPVLTGTVGDAVAAAGRSQLRIAETEKYAHVTYFFNGGREERLAGEERIIVPSPDVATYDEQPEMSAPEVTDRVVEALEDEVYDLLVVNYANPDMVGHTGDFDAACQAVEAVDVALARILQAAPPTYHVLITSDHGNADQMVDEDGKPHTSHTARPTPLFYVGPQEYDLRDGIPADVGPTILELMGIEVPEQMTGTSLLGDPVD